jgi:flagellar protein export ATPase FliI
MTHQIHPDFKKYLNRLEGLPVKDISGRIVNVVGLTIEAAGLQCEIGEVCEIRSQDERPVLAEVIGFRNKHTLLMPLGQMEGIQPGSPVYPQGACFSAPVGDQLLGRVLNGIGEPIDDLGPLGLVDQIPTYNQVPHPLKRKKITQPLNTGIKAIDGLLTVGKGQRIGIFSGSGVGKSTLMGMIARSTATDVSVIALVGERGREVREFIERDLGEEGLQRSVLVVSTSNEPALVRLKAAWVATSIAEYFRNQGLDVTFLMDSVTRFAMAQREIGLAVGEPPASKGYTPSVFSLLPRLLERTGAGQYGTITGFYTVLVEGDDFNEPISDAVRSILDGHIMLSRDLAARNHYPAIDVLHSVSRVMPAIVSENHLNYAGRVRKLLATYEEARDLINIGAYVSGSDPEIDRAIAAMPAILDFLQQKTEDSVLFDETFRQMTAIENKGKEINHAA